MTTDPMTTNPTTAPPMSTRARSRLVLLLITAMFAAPFVAALYLYYTDWQPGRTKNYGELIHPVRDLRAVQFTRADGSRFVWNHEDHVWRVLVAPPANCGAACEQLADALRRIWIGLGHDASSVQVLWVGAAPQHGFRALLPVSADGSLAARLPDAARMDAIPVYVVDPTGYVILRYAPGFDPGGLRRDLAQLLK
jgi:cytochrome oxidase Cu insertion factor (SCO1/SenC/PrrC family)